LTDDDVLMSWLQVRAKFKCEGSRWVHKLPTQARLSSSVYRPKQPYRAPNHNSKTVLSIVKIGPPKPASFVRRQYPSAVATVDRYAPRCDCVSDV